MRPTLGQRGLALLLVATLMGLAGQAQAGPAQPPALLWRTVSDGALQPLSLVGAPPIHVIADSGAWSISEPDSGPTAGYEVAVHALDTLTTIVVHKRFADPSSEYSDALLLALRTTDGGATWTESVLDASAPESVLAIEGSVSIGGKGDDVYVVYHERDDGSFASMRLRYAHSADRGLTWTSGTIADGSVGDHTGLAVLNGSTAVASYHGDGLAEGLWVASTADGGQTWATQRVANQFASGLYSSIGAADEGHLYASHYNGELPNRTDLNVALSHDGGLTWAQQVVAGPQGHYTGLGSALVSPTPQAAFIAYEDFEGLSSTVRVARTLDGGASWETADVETALLAGWNQAIRAVDGGLLVSYWVGEGVPGQETGKARLAKSMDGGVTWGIQTVPEDGHVVPYLDMAASSLDAPVLAYQVWDPATGVRALHVAHRLPGDSIVRHEGDLGMLGGTVHMQVPFALEVAHAGIEVRLDCPTAAASIVLLPVHSSSPHVTAACIAGRSALVVPALLPAGAYLLDVTAAGRGRFAVEVLGTAPW